MPRLPPPWWAEECRRNTPWIERGWETARAWLDLQCRRAGITGVGLALALHGRWVHASGWHAARVAGLEPAQPHLPVPVGEQSMLFTAVAVLKLVDAGRLRLEDRIGHFVPVLDGPIATVTLADLLSHVSGLPRDELRDHAGDPRAPVDRHALIDAAQMAHDPRRQGRFQQSTLGFGLLGLAIEQVTGETFGAWLTREVLRAADLTNTSVDLPLPEGVTACSGFTGESFPGGHIALRAERPLHALAPALGVFSEAPSLAAFASGLDPSTPDAILSERGRRALVMPRARETGGVDGTAYGLGTTLGVLRGGGEHWPWFGQGGNLFGCRSCTLVFPSAHIGVAVTTNAADADAHALAIGCARILRMHALHAHVDRSVGRWRGTWRSLSGVLVLVALEDRVYALDLARQDPFADAEVLKPLDDDRLEVVRAGRRASIGEVLRVSRTPKGFVAAVQFGGERWLDDDNLVREVRKRHGHPAGFAGRKPPSP